MQVVLKRSLKFRRKLRPSIWHSRINKKIWIGPISLKKGKSKLRTQMQSTFQIYSLNYRTKSYRLNKIRSISYSIAVRVSWTTFRENLDYLNKWSTASIINKLVSNKNKRWARTTLKISWTVGWQIRSREGSATCRMKYRTSKWWNLLLSKPWRILLIPPSQIL